MKDIIDMHALHDESKDTRSDRGNLPHFLRGLSAQQSSILYSQENYHMTWPSS